MSNLWPLCPAYADDDYDPRQHTWAGRLGTVRCGICAGTGTRGEGAAARVCEPCRGTGEVEIESDITIH